MVIVTTVIIGTDRDGSCIIHRVEWSHNSNMFCWMFVLDPARQARQSPVPLHCVYDKQNIWDQCQGSADKEWLDTG